jgi:hypothetical protein
LNRIVLSGGYYYISAILRDIGLHTIQTCRILKKGASRVEYPNLASALDVRAFGAGRDECTCPLEDILHVSIPGGVGAAPVRIQRIIDEILLSGLGGRSG